MSPESLPFPAGPAATAVLKDTGLDHMQLTSSSFPDFVLSIPSNLIGQGTRLDMQIRLVIICGENSLCPTQQGVTSVELRCTECNKQRLHWNVNAQR